LMIADINGKVVRSENTNQSIINLDVSEIEPGVYFIDVFTPIGNKKVRMIKS